MKTKFIRNRKMRYGGIAALLTVLVIAVTVMANAVFSTLAKRYAWYGVMLPEESYEVTEDCYAFLGEVFAQNGGAKAEIIFCDKPENLQKEITQAYLYETATSLAARYPENLTVTCHDIWTNPNTVRAYTEGVDPVTGQTVQTKLKSTSVIIVAQDYHRVYALEEFYVFKGGNSADVWAYNGEKKLAAGVMRALDKNAPTVCLTKNHGEVFYDYELLYLLDDAGYRIGYIDLYNDEIPENCHMIISYNPNSDLVSDDVSEISEFDILNEFLAKEGNSFWVLLENGTPKLANYEAYLAEWGVAFDYYTDNATGSSFRYMVQDPSQSLTSDGYTIYGKTVQSGASGQILQGLDRRAVFKNATSMSAAAGFINNGDGSYTKGNRTLYSLYESGENAVSWANGKPVGGNGAMLMTLSEQKTAGEPSYVGVIASVDFSAEEFLQSAVYGNGDTLLRAFSHVGGNLTPEGLTIKPFSSQEISSITKSSDGTQSS